VLNEVVLQEANSRLPYLKGSEIEVHSKHCLAASRLSPANTPSLKIRAGITYNFLQFTLHVIYDISNQYLHPFLVHILPQKKKKKHIYSLRDI
jgi:hypothetical protein